MAKPRDLLDDLVRGLESDPDDDVTAVLEQVMRDRRAAEAGAQ